MAQKARPRTAGTLSLPRAHNRCEFPSKKPTDRSRLRTTCPPLGGVTQPRRQGLAIMKSTLHITANIEVQVRPDAKIMDGNYERLQVLAKKQTGNHHLHADIDFDGLRPLIDIAYWSTFGEVRRDAAAAFATLSKNTANLEILAQAGGLGAVLAFLNGAKDSMDLSVLRDAADTLAQLVQLPSIQMKLLKAPNGVNTVFALLRISDLQVKRSALDVLLYMLQLTEALISLFKAGAFRILVQLLRSFATRKDAKLKQTTAILLKKLAEPEKNKDLLSDDPETLHLLCLLFQDPYLDVDPIFRRDLLECMLLLSLDRRVARHLVDFHIVPSLLFMLHVPTPLHTSYLVLSILEVFAADNKNQKSLIQDDMLPNVIDAVFRCDLPQAQQNAKIDASSLRIKVLLILNHLVLLPEASRHPMIDIGLVDLIASERLHQSPDKRIKKLSITLLTTLPWVDKPSEIPRTQGAMDLPFHIELVSRGILPCLFDLLNEEITFRLEVVNAIWHLCESDSTRLLLCKSPVIEALLALSIQHDQSLHLKIAKIFADFATKSENAHKMTESRVIYFLIKCIAPSCRNDTLRYEATRAFSGLASANDEIARERMVKSGVMGFLVRLTKHTDSKSIVITATHALAVGSVQHLRHDVAALRIQGIMRNWLVKKATNAMRLDIYTSRLSPRKRRLQHAAFRAGKILQPKEDVSTEAIQSRFLGH